LAAGVHGSEGSMNATSGKRPCSGRYSPISTAPLKELAIARDECILDSLPPARVSRFGGCRRDRWASICARTAGARSRRSLLNTCALPPVDHNFEILVRGRVQTSATLPSTVMPLRLSLGIRPRRTSTDPGNVRRTSQACRLRLFLSPKLAQFVLTLGAHLDVCQ